MFVNSPNEYHRWKWWCLSSELLCRWNETKQLKHLNQHGPLSLEQESANYIQVQRSSASVNKVLLNPSLSTCLYTICGCFHATPAELTSLQKRLYGPEAWNIHDLNIFFLQEKFVNSWFRESDFSWRQDLGLNGSRPTAQLPPLFLQC